MSTNNQQVEEIYQLLSENKIDEARESLKAVLNEEMSDQETGRVLFESTMLYLKIMNDINERYIEETKARLKSLEELTKIEEDNKKLFGLAKSRLEINQS